MLLGIIFAVFAYFCHREYTHKINALEKLKYKQIKTEEKDITDDSKDFQVSLSKYNNICQFCATGGFAFLSIAVAILSVGHSVTINENMFSDVYAINVDISLMKRAGWISFCGFAICLITFLISTVKINGLKNKKINNNGD
jgi:hypothetical protein